MRCSRSRPTIESSSDKNQRIVRRLRQSQMKIEVGFNVSIRIVVLLIHHCHRFSHQDQVLLLNARGRERGDLRLKNRAHLRQMNRSRRLANLHHQSQRLPNRLRGTVRNECSASRVGFHQSFFAQGLHRFTHRSPADPELSAPDPAPPATGLQPSARPSESIPRSAERSARRVAMSELSCTQIPCARLAFQPRPS